ncbi:MAG: glycosyltransferase family 39 protein [Thermodesulfobacteriota bacterium]
MHATPSPTSRLRERFVLTLVFLAACWLYLGNLGNILLWQDEAQTALIAKTVLARGIPYGTDGVNFFSQERGAEYGENFVYKWQTWLPFYVLALFFQLFGESTFVARLPFALFGMATLFLLHRYVREATGDGKTAMFTTLVLCVSIPWLLLARQCRYYSMTAFFALLALYGFLRIVTGRRWGETIFATGAVALFHCHYLYVASLLAAVGLQTLLLHRDRLLRMLLVTGVVIGINAPWLIWLSGMKYGQAYSASFLDPQLFLWRLTGFARDSAAHALPLPFLGAALAVGIGLVFRCRPPRGRDGGCTLSPHLLTPLLFIVFTLVALCASAPAPFFRYLSPLLPLYALIAGVVLRLAWQLHPLVTGALALYLLSRQPLLPYFHELTHDYTGPVERIVDHLKANASPTDVVAITYGDMPVKFYTGLRVVGGLTGEDLAPARNADWIVIRQHLISDKDAEVRDFLARTSDWHNYERIVLPGPDVPFENRESPDEHLFASPTEGPPLIIFRRRPST